MHKCVVWLLWCILGCITSSAVLYLNISQARLICEARNVHRQKSYAITQCLFAPDACARIKCTTLHLRNRPACERRFESESKSNRFRFFTFRHTLIIQIICEYCWIQPGSINLSCNVDFSTRFASTLRLRKIAWRRPVSAHAKILWIGTRHAAVKQLICT